MEALGRYGLTCCEVWTEAGRADTCAATQDALARAGALPHWLGDAEFHRCHQSALVRKDPDFYGPRFPGVPDDLPYVWPEA